MKLVILESPYRGAGETKDLRLINTSKNVNYARRCVRDSLQRGEAPLASHLLYTQPGILDDEIPEERTLGIEAGFVWLPHVHFHIYYVDFGWSFGMIHALYDYTLPRKIPFKVRALDNEPKIPSHTALDIEAILRSNMEYPP